MAGFTGGIGAATLRLLAICLCLLGTASLGANRLSSLHPRERGVLLSGSVMGCVSGGSARGACDIPPRSSPKLASPGGKRIPR